MDCIQPPRKHCHNITIVNDANNNQILGNLNISIIGDGNTLVNDDPIIKRNQPGFERSKKVDFVLFACPLMLWLQYSV
ncbi:hypothetical protein VIBNISOn1_1390029 [Vibrio nigripulchritudo SOn1]|uniref:Uncharacterized protein n=1 Tax=Vibrio nigripulchritudo SOn1 TaxID=1238450 RepID=A0AAV2VKG3_9VIBR|nr:hypothetical protein VIBNISOn1_1390029 [Vibrio nigripulchritudo SOn1]